MSSVTCFAAVILVLSSTTLTAHSWPYHHQSAPERAWRSSEIQHTKLNDRVLDAERKVWFEYFSKNTAKFEKARREKLRACQDSFAKGTVSEQIFAEEHGCRRKPL